MKILIYSLCLLICSFTSLNAQNNDSLGLKNEIKRIENEINRVYQNTILQNKRSEKISEDIDAYNSKQLEELLKLQTILLENSKDFETIENSLQEIEEVSNNNTRKIWGFEIRNYVVQFILLGLLVFLIIFVIRFRRQSLDYLLTKANNLADQNDIIIEKADELQVIKKKLKELIDEQKKKQKLEKKSSRNKKKKK